MGMVIPDIITDNQRETSDRIKELAAEIVKMMESTEQITPPIASLDTIVEQAFTEYLRQHRATLSEAETQDLLRRDYGIRLSPQTPLPVMVACFVGAMIAEHNRLSARRE